MHIAIENLLEKVKKTNRPSEKQWRDWRKLVERHTDSPEEYGAMWSMVLQSAGGNPNANKS